MLAELERYLFWLNEDTHDFEIHFNQKVVVVIQTRAAKKNSLGHFASERWSTKEGEPIHEISLSAEFLQRDPYEVLETLHHEAIHLYNFTHGVKDASTSGRHNQKFRDAAIEHGLEFPRDETTGKAVADRTHGFAHTYATAELLAAQRDLFQPKLEVFSLFRQIVLKPKAPTKMKKWYCECEPKPVIVRAATEIEVECQVCGRKFVKDED